MPEQLDTETDKTHSYEGLFYFNFDALMLEFSLFCYPRTKYHLLYCQLLPMEACA